MADGLFEKVYNPDVVECLFINTNMSIIMPDFMTIIHFYDILTLTKKQ